MLRVSLPASRKTAEKSRGHSLRKPSSEPVQQNDGHTLMLLMAIPGPGTSTQILFRAIFFPQHCLSLSGSKHTWVKSPFLLAAFMLLLCRQQPPDIPDNDSAVVNLKYIATLTAGKPMRNNHRGVKNINLLRIFLVDMNVICPYFSSK